MNALVTGGTGFLGTHLVPRLLAEGWRVRCLVRGGSSIAALQEAIPAADRGRLNFVEGNLADSASCAEAVAGCTHVFHLAAEMRGSTASLFLTNVVGTRHMIAAATTAAVQRFVLVSSLAVYAPMPVGARLDEDSALEPAPHLRDAYTYSKVVQEGIAWDAHGLALVVIRPGVIYGPGRDCLSGRIGIRLGNLLIAMGGKQTMPYVHVDNVAQAIALAATRPGIVGQAFNVVDDDPPTGRALLKQYRKAVGGVRSVTIPGWLIPVLSGWCEWYHRQSRGQLPAVLTRYKSRAMWTRLMYSNARAKQVLGWRPEKQFSEGLPETYAWIRQQRAAGTPDTA